MLQTRQVQALVNSLHSMELDLSKKKEKLREKVALEKRRDDARTEATKLEATRLVRRCSAAPLPSVLILSLRTGIGREDPNRSSSGSKARERHRASSTGVHDERIDRSPSTSCFFEESRIPRIEFEGAQIVRRFVVCSLSVGS